MPLTKELEKMEEYLAGNQDSLGPAIVPHHLGEPVCI